MAKKRAASIGKCELCGGQFSKAAISRHLAKCIEQASVPSASGRQRKLRDVFHLLVEGRYLTEFWLHVESAAESDFASLDHFLRGIWLECCGHCSEFRFPEPVTTRAAKKGLSLEALFDDFDMDAMIRKDREIMESPLGARAKVGDVFDYEYDFGSTTELRLKVLSQREGTLKRNEVRLLARNLPPEILCRCGQPAEWVCGQCSWEPAGWLCKKCSNRHPCGDEFFLPVVNSPRVGVCGYCGPEV